VITSPDATQLDKTVLLSRVGRCDQGSRRIEPAHFGCVEDNYVLRRYATQHGVGIVEPRADDGAGNQVGIADGDGWSNMSQCMYRW